MVLVMLFSMLSLKTPNPNGGYENVWRRRIRKMKNSIVDM